MVGPIYLDNNATTRIDPRVADAMAEAIGQGYANPASQHEPGRRARRALEAARRRVGELVGARMGGRDPDRVIFTSGGTEANHLAIRGLALAASPHHLGLASDLPPAATGSPPTVLVSPIEHPSLLAAAESLIPLGWHVAKLEVNSDGRVDPPQLSRQLTAQTRLVSVMLGNNETGVLQSVKELASICRAAGVLFHTDAIQGVGKIDVNFADLGVDAMSLTAHKFHGPPGIGGLVIGPHLPIVPQLGGGFQQQGLRGGTEPVVLAIGFAAALELWHSQRQERLARMSTLRDQFEREITSQVDSALIVGGSAPRLPHTSNIAFRGLDRQALAMALDLEGVACSTGSACASGSSEPSPVLLAMGCDEQVVRGALRFSLGADTRSAEVVEAARRISKVCKQLRQAK